MTCLSILISEATDREKSTDIRAEGRFKSWGQKTDEKMPGEVCIDKKTDRKWGRKADSVKRHMRTLITEAGISDRDKKLHPTEYMWAHRRAFGIKHRKFCERIDVMVSVRNFSVTNFRKTLYKVHLPISNVHCPSFTNLVAVCSWIWRRVKSDARLWPQSALSRLQPQSYREEKKLERSFEKIS